MINAGPNDKVALRGLTHEGAGIGNAGINFNTGGGSLEVVNCVVRDFTDDGIIMQPS